MAPGVSAALVTTVIALLVAIPAKFGYNFLASSIRVTIVRMDGFAIELTTAFQRHFGDQAPRSAALPSLTEMGAGTAAPAAADEADPPAKDRAPAPQKRSARPDPEETTESLPGFDSGLSPSPTAPAD